MLPSGLETHWLCRLGGIKGKQWWRRFIGYRESTHREHFQELYLSVMCLLSTISSFTCPVISVINAK